MINLMELLSQKSLPHANNLIGHSKYYIHAYGDQITLIAEIMGLTPDEVNERLTAVDGYSADLTGELTQVIWEKIVPAFPEWAAQYIEPYNNEVVLDALSKGRGVIVLADHAVRYMGGGVLHDPIDGTEKPTSTYPNVKAFVVLTHIIPKGTPEGNGEDPGKHEVEPPIEFLKDTPPRVTSISTLPLAEKKLILKHLKKATREIKKLLAI